MLPHGDLLYFGFYLFLFIGKFYLYIVLKKKGERKKRKGKKIKKKEDDLLMS